MKRTLEGLEDKAWKKTAQHVFETKRKWWLAGFQSEQNCTVKGVWVRRK